MNGVPAWTAVVGSWEIPVQEFVEEVRTFDSSFMQAMKIRVDQIMAGWSRQGVHIDKDNLLLQQADRSTWLTQALASADQEQSFDWNPVLSAIDHIDSETKI